jgi:hypothetical protein
MYPGRECSPIFVPCSAWEANEAKTTMKIHAIDDYTALGMNCSHCNIADSANISLSMLYQQHGGHLKQVTVSLLAPSRGLKQSILRIRASPQQAPLTRAMLIKPKGPQATLHPARRATGFTKQEIARRVGKQFEVFLLPGETLLAIRRLAAGPKAGSRNDIATQMLRLAADDPGGVVYGNALLLGAGEI